MLTLQRYKSKINSRILEFCLTIFDILTFPLAKFNLGHGNTYDTVVIFTGKVGDFFIFLTALEQSDFNQNFHIICSKEVEPFVSELIPSSMPTLVDWNKFKTSPFYRVCKRRALSKIITNTKKVIFSKPDFNNKIEGALLLNKSAISEDNFNPNWSSAIFRLQHHKILKDDNNFDHLQNHLSFMLHFLNSCQSK